ncbi:hypothetical protein BLNAU_13697 [Blattamonas nauphoetae]|uniref:Uncharacterized protein n=1 Tax=Blattamonas nauphoetae TaxID=2049346 RepID=A0ABQ9XJ11_9EUKA|nr:hypothetical protein BLNAU_13697 [Blattamonas nauphoetae]
MEIDSKERDLLLVCAGLSETDQSMLSIWHIFLASEDSPNQNFVFATPFSFPASAFPKTPIGDAASRVIVEDVNVRKACVGWGRGVDIWSRLSEGLRVDPSRNHNRMFISTHTDTFRCSLGTVVDSSATSAGCSITPAGTLARTLGTAYPTLCSAGRVQNVQRGHIISVSFFELIC